MRKRTRYKQTTSETQLDFDELDVSHTQGWWECKGIFAPNYLRQHLLKSGHVSRIDECREPYETIQSRWVENFPGLRKQNEAYTCSRFLEPTLKNLGWHYLPQQKLPEGRTKKKPDYCLFLDESTEQRAAGLGVLDILRCSATVLEAKKVKHPLDAISEKETPGLFPSQQIQDYLYHAQDNTGRFFNWAILTNGNCWRLYCEQAARDGYFEFTLADDERFCPIEEFALFLALFRPEAFAKDSDGRCLLDSVREESLSQQAELETNLRRRVFNVLEELAEGFFNNPDNNLAEEDLPRVYETSLVFLYRLLFILYAESRGLLPVKTSGFGANQRYRNEYSLSRLVERLRDASNYTDDAFYDLYEQLLRLFNLINGTHKAQNDALNVTRYNGGLFDPPNHPEIEQWRVGEKTLANVLRQLVFVQPPPRGRDRQQVLQTNETVDYGTLEVRQLGDIYEGLLGGRLALREGKRLELVDEQGRNHQEGIFYTPDWVVRYLVKEALQPLIEEIDQRPDVQAAKGAKSTERKQNDSFALSLLNLKLVDPAMGSAHFLVRATEWLAEQIVYHPTTRTKTERVTTGDNRRTREEILAAGLVPVSPGVSQEQAEIAYWRRRVVECCIYGVDTNLLAVELAKLSLWLTCIAVDEPLSFLDHHLREGNSLIGVTPEEAHRPPVMTSQEDMQVTVNVSDALPETLRQVIATHVNIQEEASTELEIVKSKEDHWRSVRAQLSPFFQTLDLWLASLGGSRFGGLSVNALDYRDMALSAIAPQQLTPAERKRAEKLWSDLQPIIQQRKVDLQPFHWYLEFPAVFYREDGTLKPEDERGFDAVLGNPPYISTHTSSEEKWRSVLQQRAGYLEDLYVHFTDLGFQLLRSGGTFGFIVSDTFFTLASKRRMREQLQSHRLTHLGQCDPFVATVDAAIFVARKESPAEDDHLLFIQARYGNKDSKPEKELPALPAVQEVTFTNATEELGARHGSQGCLRLHDAPAQLYRDALKQAFFEPRPAVLELYRRFNEPIKELVEEWWEQIETSQKFTDNLDEIRRYHATLKPGDVTLVGLIAEGGQGMRTGNNARFIGYLDGTRKAEAISAKREKWTEGWLSDSRIAPKFRQVLRENGGNPDRPLANPAAWEASIEPLKQNFDARSLGFGRTDLYRIVPPELVATSDDFEFTWQRRKPELLSRWREEPLFHPFWGQRDTAGAHERRQKWLKAENLSDKDFCSLCQELQDWVENRPKKKGEHRKALGLHSSETYTDPADAPRIATIYNGLMGRGQWVPFRKGDPEGNRWTDDEQLFINWSANSVAWLSTASEARWQGHAFFFTSGVTYTFLGNHVALKSKLQEPSIFDASASRLTSVVASMPPMCLLAVFNSNVFSFTLKKFIKNTPAFEINDLRMAPVAIPTRAQSKRLGELAERAIQAKQLTFTTDSPPNDLVAFARSVGDELTEKAPAYLRPPAQQLLLSTAAACLSLIELAVNWEAEKLYGVEGLGPFDEF